MSLIRRAIAVVVKNFSLNASAVSDHDGIAVGFRRNRLFAHRTNWWDIKVVHAASTTASAEGSITHVRNLCGPQLVAPTNQFIQQFPLGQEPVIQIGNLGRIRVTFPVAVNALCYMKLAI